MNIFIGSGRLVAAPEYSSTATGGIVARFRIAIPKRFKQEGKPEADFFNCVAFGKTAETIEKCRIDKGTKLIIKGEVQNNDYEKDGVKHYSDQINVDFFEFCESKASTDGVSDASLPVASMGSDDDLPF